MTSPAYIFTIGIQSEDLYLHDFIKQKKNIKVKHILNWMVKKQSPSLQTFTKLEHNMNHLLRPRLI